MGIEYGSDRTIAELRADYDAALTLAGWQPSETYVYQRIPSQQLEFNYVIAAKRQPSFPTNYRVILSSQTPAIGVCNRPR